MHKLHTLYSYSERLTNNSHSVEFSRHLRKQYLLRILLLAILSPLDIFLSCFARIKLRATVHTLIATHKFSEAITPLGKLIPSSYIGDSLSYIQHYLRIGSFIPASPLYLVVTLLLLLPHSDFLESLAIQYCIFYLNHFAPHLKLIIVHSDALPFARLLIYSAKALNIKSLCIQHGHFSLRHSIDETDGFLCTHNIVRDEFTALLLNKDSDSTKILIDPRFFSPTSSARSSNTRPAGRILLVGEGLHIIDKNLSIAYIKLLRNIYRELRLASIATVYRPHPSESPLHFISFVPAIDLYSLSKSLEYTSAVIGYGSTLLLDAANIGIPSFVVSPLSQPSPLLSSNTLIPIRPFIDIQNLLSLASIVDSTVEQHDKSSPILSPDCKANVISTFCNLNY
jgi:hypothetical protein